MDLHLLDIYIFFSIYRDLIYADYKSPFGWIHFLAPPRARSGMLFFSFRKLIRGTSVDLEIVSTLASEVLYSGFRPFWVSEAFFWF